MRLLLFAALAAVLLSPSAEAQEQPVEAWYEITSGERTETLHARSVVMKTHRGRTSVTAGRQTFDFRGAVRLAALGVYDPSQPRPGAGRPQTQGFTATETTTTISNGGKTTTVTSTISRVNGNGSSSTSTTTTTTTQNDDGSTTTTSTTTHEEQPAK